MYFGQRTYVDVLCGTMGIFSINFAIPLLLAVFVAGSPVDEQKAVFPRPQLPIRLILCDIDGTLTSSDERFVEYNIEGFHLASRLGIQVVFATGRDLDDAQGLFGARTLQKLGYVGIPGIYADGAYVVNGQGRVIQDWPLSKQQQWRIFRSFRALGLANIEVATSPRREANHRKGNTPNTKYYLIAAYGDPKLIDKAEKHLKNEFNGELVVGRWLPYAIGLRRPGFSKGSGLRALTADMGISPEEVLVLGDARNDVPMFQVAGTAVAVANAKKIAKEAADYVTVDSSEGALLAVVKEIQRLGYYPDADSSQYGTQ